jgi:pimeloyl-ACP methyl ester carboxylesterase
MNPPPGHRALFRPPTAADDIYRRYRALLEDWPVPARHRTLATSQGDTFVVSCGTADRPPVLLIHGAVANAATWIGDVATLAPHFRLHAVDVIGEPGLSAPSRPPLASDAYARWLGEVLDALEVESAHVVGISLGGWLGFDLAIRMPARVRSLTAIVPAGIGPQRNVLAWALPLSLLGRWGRRRLRERIMGKAPPDHELSDAERRFGELYELIGRHFRPRYVHLPIFTDADLAGLDMPVMAIVAGRDVMLAPRPMKQRLEAQVRDLEMRYLPDARHYPGTQVEPVLDFLLRCSGFQTTQPPLAGSGVEHAPAAPPVHEV